MTDATQRFTIVEDVVPFILWENAETPEEIAASEMLSDLGKTTMLKKLADETINAVSKFLELADDMLVSDSTEVRMLMVDGEYIIAIGVDWSSDDYNEAFEAQAADADEDEELKWLSFDECGCSLFFESSEWGVSTVMKNNAAILTMTWSDTKAAFEAGIEMLMDDGWVESLIEAAKADTAKADL